jgi:hypothetical protein
MKTAVKILNIVSLVLAILATLVGFFVRIPVVQAFNALYSLIVGLICIIKAAKKKPSIVLGVFCLLDFLNPAAWVSGIVMIVNAILTKKLPKDEETEEYVEEYVEEYAE